MPDAEVGEFGALGGERPERRDCLEQLRRQPGLGDRGQLLRRRGARQRQLLGHLGRNGAMLGSGQPGQRQQGGGEQGDPHVSCPLVPARPSSAPARTPVPKTARPGSWHDVLGAGLVGGGTSPPRTLNGRPSSAARPSTRRSTPCGAQPAEATPNGGHHGVSAAIRWALPVDHPVGVPARGARRRVRASKAKCAVPATKETPPAPCECRPQIPAVDREHPARRVAQVARTKRRYASAGTGKIRSGAADGALRTPDRLPRWCPDEASDFVPFRPGLSGIVRAKLLESGGR